MSTDTVSYAGMVAFFADIVSRADAASPRHPSPLVYDSAIECLAVLDNALPSGAGFDARPERCTGGAAGFGRIRWAVPFHAMNADGWYVRWAQYVVTARPSWDGSPDVTVKGPACNGTRDYVADVYAEFLARPWRRSFDPARGWTVTPCE
jgi:hypothetical protein